MAVEQSERFGELEEVGYGERQGKAIRLKDFEALYLLYSGKMSLKDGKGKGVSFEELAKANQARVKDSWTKFIIYRDLRSRGYVVKDGFGFGTDLRVYERGDFPAKAAKFVVFALDEGTEKSLGDLRDSVQADSEDGEGGDSRGHRAQGRGHLLQGDQGDLPQVGVLWRSDLEPQGFNLDTQAGQLRDDRLRRHRRVLRLEARRPSRRRRSPWGSSRASLSAPSRWWSTTTTTSRWTGSTSRRGPSRAGRSRRAARWASLSLMLVVGFAATALLLNLEAVLIVALYSFLAWLYDFRAKKYGARGQPGRRLLARDPVHLRRGDLGRRGTRLAPPLHGRPRRSWLGVGREVVKAMADVVGDQKRGVRSYASVHGLRSAAALGAVFFLPAVVTSLSRSRSSRSASFYKVGVVLPDAAFVYLAYRIVTHADVQGGAVGQEDRADGDALGPHRLHRGRVLRACGRRSTGRRDPDRANRERGGPARARPLAQEVEAREEGRRCSSARRGPGRRRCHPPREASGHEPGRPQRERRPDEGQAREEDGRGDGDREPLRGEVADLPRRGGRPRREGRLRRRWSSSRSP